MSLLSPQLEAFLAIAQVGTVHRAAETLHVTQTAVTQRLKNLEMKLGTTLFTRTRRGMVLTIEGEALMRYCLTATELEGEALATIKGAGLEANVRITISGPTTTMHARIIPQCKPVMAKYPNLLLHFNITDADHIANLVRTGHSQFAILPEEDIAREMQTKPLQPEQYLLVCSSKWHNRKLKTVIKQERIIDFHPSDSLTFNYLKKYSLFEFANHDRHFVNRTESLAMLICNGFGYGCLTKEFCQPYVESGEMMILNHGKTYENQLSLAWYVRPEPPAYFRDLIDGIC